MRKLKFLIVLPFLLIACNQQTYSLKEVAGFKVKDISQMQVSSSVYTSSAWDIDEKYYSYLDCSYIKVNFDIYEEFLSSCPPSQAKDDAICIRVKTINNPLGNMHYSAFFYISYKSHYMYINSNDEGKCFRSKSAMKDLLIICLLKGYQHGIRSENKKISQ